MKSFKIEIQNRNTSIFLGFIADEERQLMVEAIKNCIKNPLDFPNIDYRDAQDYIIFTADYLKHSLIKIPHDAK